MLNHKATTQSLEGLMQTILNRRRINRETQQALMASLLGKAQLNSHEQAQVQKIFEAISQGRLRVID
ncbi:hypothetical protein D0962_07265 [Leptolyngbyaceae cyanobacterium CCMR0082]|uniref:Uncharacterized protein n=2 Tax=Adonisia turfae TaxID=2950184 RepID=A0A6M0S283_9CYAN|nr:hypothetical protein [Adonisia turfae]MDV3347706.1 hypothetical protein [Leptothoe sp. LEGE 181152]NEZ57880.1 hypothetical protein [Adonisia turfae CCMR0081]NEZ62584.1 hypothetical protein [Adonisia turfae CCMR0082]